MYGYEMIMLVFGKLMYSLAAIVILKKLLPVVLASVPAS